MTQPAYPVSPSTAKLLIRGATVVDTRDGSLQFDQDVLIEGERIVSVGPSQQGEVLPTLHVVEAHGKYLIPGFADMHAHPLSQKNPAGSLELMLAHGITGFRQMSGSVQMLKQRDAGTLLPSDSPRLLAMPGPILTPLNARSAAAALVTMREQHALGADFIKAGLVTSEVFYETQTEARRLGIPILGHLPNGIDVVRASGEGMKSIEHLGPGVGILACCSAEHDAIQADAAARPQLKVPPLLIPLLGPVFERAVRKIVINPINLARQADVDLLERASGTFDQGAAATLAERFVRDGTWQVPTLIRSRTMLTCDDDALSGDPNLRYISSSTLKGWSKASKKFSKFPTASKETFRLVNATLLKLTKLLDDVGVRMLAGSDACGAAWEVPGIALHQEFDELARAGLSPLRILQMTTRDAADFLNAADDMGSVSAGKYSDLVLLDANPIESVDHLHGIVGVVRSGRYYAKERLDALKENVASARSVH
jgi:imidazolonepropionase-like amidohydrolase